MPVEARLHFRQELQALEEQALEGLDMVVAALERTLEAVLHQDIELASYVIADDDRIDGRYLEVRQGILSLMARQAPVASDLRLIAALLDLTRNVERMGDQCVNIAKLVPLVGREPPVEEGILARIDRMMRQAISQTAQCKQAFSRRDVQLAEDLVRQDDEIDRLNREIFSLALQSGDDRDAREWGATMMLVARSIERVGDNAVDIGEQTAFVVTGLFREFTDASHPEIESNVVH
ncbi:MAG: phosphate signaling complex protein PhoU [Actinomycetota bacterium]|nr:phosphate signaling complex protein PhoU [Actinomycetota bacterium]